MLLLPAPALAGDGDGSLLDDPRLEKVSEDLAGIFDALEDDGLPVGMLEAKIREGLVKKVAPEKILGAVRVLDGRLRKFASLVEDASQPATAGSYELGTQLLAFGLADTDARRLLEGFSDAKLDAKDTEKGLLVTVMAVEKGKTPGQAVDHVLSILADGGKKGLDAEIAKHAGKGPKGKGPKGKSPKGKGPKSKGDGK